MTGTFLTKWLMSLVCILAVCGCDPRARPRYDHLDLIQVSGRVTLDGQAVSGAVITFTDNETRKFSYDKTDSNGNYKLQFDSQELGILEGQKVVEVSMTRKILGLNSDEEEFVNEEARGQNKQAADSIPDCYRKDSQIMVHIDGSQTTYNFDLKSDCSTTGPS